MRPQHRLCTCSPSGQINGLIKKMEIRKRLRKKTDSVDNIHEVQDPIASHGLLLPYLLIVSEEEMWAAVSMAVHPAVQVNEMNEGTQAV